MLVGTEKDNSSLHGRVDNGIWIFWIVDNWICNLFLFKSYDLKAEEFSPVTAGSLGIRR